MQDHLRHPADTRGDRRYAARHGLQGHQAEALVQAGHQQQVGAAQEGRHVALQTGVAHVSRVVAVVQQLPHGRQVLAAADEPQLGFQALADAQEDARHARGVLDRSEVGDVDDTARSRRAVYRGCLRAWPEARQVDEIADHAWAARETERRRGQPRVAMGNGGQRVGAAQRRGQFRRHRGVFAAMRHVGAVQRADQPGRGVAQAAAHVLRHIGKRHGVVEMQHVQALVHDDLQNPIRVALQISLRPVCMQGCRVQGVGRVRQQGMQYHAVRPVPAAQRRRAGKQVHVMSAPGQRNGQFDADAGAAAETGVTHHADSHALLLFTNHRIPAGTPPRRQCRAA